MKVRLTQGRMVDIDKRLPTYDMGYLGLTIVAKDCIEADWQCAVVLQQWGDDRVVAYVLREAVKWDIAPRACDLTGLGWREIDIPEDDAMAEKPLQTWGLNAFRTKSG